MRNQHRRLRTRLASDWPQEFWTQCDDSTEPNGHETLYPGLTSLPIVRRTVRELCSQWVMIPSLVSDLCVSETELGM